MTINLHSSFRRGRAGARLRNPHPAHTWVNTLNEAPGVPDHLTPLGPPGTPTAEAAGLRAGLRPAVAYTIRRSGASLRGSRSRPLARTLRDDDQFTFVIPEGARRRPAPEPTRRSEMCEYRK